MDGVHPFLSLPVGAAIDGQLKLCKRAGLGPEQKPDLRKDFSKNGLNARRLLLHRKESKLDRTTMIFD
jgi:hypothetical protein